MTLTEDERAEYRAGHGLARRRIPNAVVGAFAVVACLLGLYLAFVKHIPFTGYGYEVEATFANALNVSNQTPVRIAGINVGHVLGTERNGDTTTVRFNVEDEGRPIKEDAMVKIRPRMFFEGNYFLDLDPGSPSAPELEDGGSIPISHTATGVQFDEVLRALREPARDDLRALLTGYGTALTHVPTPAEDVGFDPEIKGKSAAAALNRSFDYGPRAGKSSARVADAFRGTEQDDLSKMIAATGKTFASLGRHETQLQELVTNWSTFTGALASESTNLAATFRELAPTLKTTDESLANLNSTLPTLRAWARAFEPAVAKLPSFIRGAEPWLAQADPLISREEAGGVVRMLRRSIPGLAGAGKAGLKTLDEIGLLSRCTSKVLVPTGNIVINDRFSTGGPNYREFFYSTVNLAGESQNFDGNGYAIALQPEIGTEFSLMMNPEPVPYPAPLAQGDDSRLWAATTSEQVGIQPQLGGMPPFKPTVPCHTNDVPDLNSGLGSADDPTPTIDDPSRFPHTPILDSSGNPDTTSP